MTSLGIAADGAGNSYVTRAVQRHTTFGAGEANQTTLTSAGDFDLFVARYDANGALVWASDAGGTGFEDRSLAIATDGAGNSYITGYSSARRPSAPARPTRPRSPPPGRDIFIATYDPSGALVGPRARAARTAMQGSGIVIDDAGNSYLTGFFQRRGDLRRRRGQRDHDHLHGAPRHFLAKFSGVVDADGDGIAG